MIYNVIILSRLYISETKTFQGLRKKTPAKRRRSWVIRFTLTALLDCCNPTLLSVRFLSDKTESCETWRLTPRSLPDWLSVDRGEERDWLQSSLTRVLRGDFPTNRPSQFSVWYFVFSTSLQKSSQFFPSFFSSSQGPAVFWILMTRQSWDWRAWGQCCQSHHGDRT